MNIYDTNGPDEYLAGAAYDPLDDEVVLVGGCSVICPTNATWVYSGDVWDNVTASVGGSMPAMYGASVVWDPAYDAILEIGGVNLTGGTVNTTWAFYGDFWLDITLFVGTAGTYDGSENGTAYATAAWDGALQEVVLVNGCVWASCEDVWGYWWYLNATGWHNGGTSPTSGGSWDFNWGQSMAYDPQMGDLVLFGGYNFSYNGTFLPINGTYLFTSEGTWVNVTSTSGSVLCIFICATLYPPARAYAPMTWDGQLGAIVMYGGTSASGILNDIWYFVDGTWYDDGILSGLPSPSNSPPAMTEAAMPSNSTDIAPLMVGGICPEYDCFNNSWVLEIPTNLSITGVDPQHTDTNLTTEVTIGAPAGTGSGPEVSYLIYDYNNLVYAMADDVNFSVGWTASATLSLEDYPVMNDTISAEAWDFFGVFSSTVYSYVTVNATPSASPDWAPPTGEVGIPVNFLPFAADGTPPYTYTWGFGDGSAVSHLAAPSHTYTAAGTYHGYLVLTDAVDVSYNATFTIDVNLALTAAPSSTPSPTEVGVPAAFTSGADFGVEPYSYVWGFGDHSAVSTSPAPSHTYSTAGTYHAYLDLSDADGATVNTTVTVDVNASLAASVSVPAADAGTGAAFSTTITAGTGVGPFTWTWGFGDGSATSSAKTPTHTYAESGTYHGYVVITDHLGVSVNKTFEIVVNPPVTAEAAANVTTTDAGLSVGFTGTPGGGTGTYTTYSWAFGDHGTAATATADHTYTAAGTYIVYFNVTDSAGGTATSRTSVTVNAALDVGSISPSSTSPSTSTAVTFTLPVSGGTPGYTYAWSFGDGGTSTDASPTHTYASTGTYTVTVTVKDTIAGSAVTKTLSVTVKNPSSSVLAGLTSGAGLYALIGVIVVVIAAIAALALFRRRKQKPSPGPLTPANTGTGTTPGAGNEGGTPPASPPSGAT